MLTEAKWVARYAKKIRRRQKFKSQGLIGGSTFQGYCVTITGVPLFLYDTVARQWFEPNDLPPHLVEFAKQFRPREDILQLPLISIIECRQFGYAKVVQFRMVGDAALYE